MTCKLKHPLPDSLRSSPCNVGYDLEGKGVDVSSDADVLDLLGAGMVGLYSAKILARRRQ